MNGAIRGLSDDRNLLMIIMELREINTAKVAPKTSDDSKIIPDSWILIR